MCQVMPVRVSISMFQEDLCSVLYREEERECMVEMRSELQSSADACSNCVCSEIRLVFPDKILFVYHLFSIQACSAIWWASSKEGLHEPEASVILDQIKLTAAHCNSHPDLLT